MGGGAGKVAKDLKGGGLSQPGGAGPGVGALHGLQRASDLDKSREADNQSVKTVATFPPEEGV